MQYRLVAVTTVVFNVFNLSCLDLARCIITIAAAWCLEFSYCIIS